MPSPHPPTRWGFTWVFVTKRLRARRKLYNLQLSINLSSNYAEKAGFSTLQKQCYPDVVEWRQVSLLSLRRARLLCSVKLLLLKTVPCLSTEFFFIKRTRTEGISLVSRLNSFSSRGQELRESLFSGGDGHSRSLWTSLYRPRPGPPPACISGTWGVINTIYSI